MLVLNSLCQCKRYTTTRPYRSFLRERVKYLARRKNILLKFCNSICFPALFFAWTKLPMHWKNFTSHSLPMSSNISRSSSESPGTSSCFRIWTRSLQKPGRVKFHGCLVWAWTPAEGFLFREVRFYLVLHGTRTEKDQTMTWVN